MFSLFIETRTSTPADLQNVEEKFVEESVQHMRDLMAAEGHEYSGHALPPQLEHMIRDAVSTTGTRADERGHVVRLHLPDGDEAGCVVSMAPDDRYSLYGHQLYLDADKIIRLLIEN